MTANWPWPAPENDGGADHLTPGLALPDITLAVIDGMSISLAALDGAWIVFVYPWTGSPGRPNPPNWDDIRGAHGSTPEIEGFRDAYVSYRALGYNVLGISGQAPEDQQEFANRSDVRFPLASDANGKLRDALKLPTFETGGVTYLKRLTLVVRDGKIERAVYPVHPPHTHAGELLAALNPGG